MARIRMIKPEFFDDPHIADLSAYARLFFIGLWMQADRAGRLVDDPRRLKARIFPYDDVNVEALAVELHGRDMIRRYSDVEGHGYIWIRSFEKHQRPHPKEPPSVIPAWSEETAKRHGEPCKETEGTSESGSLVHGTQNLERETRNLRPVSLSPPADAARDPFTNPDVTKRAGHFCERYQELYPKHRNGARYALRPVRDYAAAVTLCQTWPDDERLEKLAICFLTTDHKFAAEGSRTIPQFLALASWVDGELATWEAKRA